jgi:small subunit ribosomal protein S20
VPRIKSAIKRVEVAERNRNRNKAWKSAVRTARNAVADSLNVADKNAADTNLNQMYRVIDQAVSKGILHKNSAARKKSRLAKLVFKLSPAKKSK